MNKPTVFIGSSRGGIDVALALQMNLEDEADTLIWNDQVFSVGEYFVCPELSTVNNHLSRSIGDWAGILSKREMEQLLNEILADLDRAPIS